MRAITRAHLRSLLCRSATQKSRLSSLAPRQQRDFSRVAECPAIHYLPHQMGRRMPLAVTVILTRFEVSLLLKFLSTQLLIRG